MNGDLRNLLGFQGITRFLLPLRKVVGPLLTSADGRTHNVYTDRVQGQFAHGPMTDKFVSRSADDEKDG